jgi:hypothetical protein
MASEFVLKISITGISKSHRSYTQRFEQCDVTSPPLVQEKFTEMMTSSIPLGQAHDEFYFQFAKLLPILQLHPRLTRQMTSDISWSPKRDIQNSTTPESQIPQVVSDICWPN